MIRFQQAREGTTDHGWFRWFTRFRHSSIPSQGIAFHEKKIAQIAHRLSDEISRQVVQPAR